LPRTLKKSNKISGLWIARTHRVYRYCAPKSSQHSVTYAQNWRGVRRGGGRAMSACSSAIQPQPWQASRSNPQFKKMARGSVVPHDVV
jgi:hypothetical protein